jgi:hypothetical protein
LRPRRGDSICGTTATLRHVGLLVAVCLPPGGLVEDPEACPRRTTAVALQEDQYAHGSIQLATEHHSDELMSLLDLLEDLDDTIALLDLTTSRVEKEDQS